MGLRTVHPGYRGSSRHPPPLWRRAGSPPPAMARTTTSTATSTSRSRHSLLPRPPRLGPAELLLVLLVAMHEAVRAPSYVRHRTMPAVQVELDRAGALGEAGDILGLVKHPAVRQYGDYLMLCVGHRVADRLAMRAFW
jgi:hypothetical protein